MKGVIEGFEVASSHPLLHSVTVVWTLEIGISVAWRPLYIILSYNIISCRDRSSMKDSRVIGVIEGFEVST